MGTVRLVVGLTRPVTEFNFGSIGQLLQGACASHKMMSTCERDGQALTRKEINRNSGSRSLDSEHNPFSVMIWFRFLLVTRCVACAISTSQLPNMEVWATQGVSEMNKLQKNLWEISCAVTQRSQEAITLDAHQGSATKAKRRSK